MSKENTAVFIGHNECYGVTSEQIKEAIERIESFLKKIEESA